MKTYLVRHREGTSRVQATRFRVTYSQRAKFYQGLRKVAWFYLVYSVTESKETNE